MMTRILAASAAIVSVAAIAAPAFAVTTSPALTSTVTITGSVAPLCSTGSLPQGSSTVPLGALSNADGTQKTITVPTIPLGNMYCNGANSTVAVSATPIGLLANVANPDSTHFTDRVDYKLSATFNGTALPNTIDTASAATKSTSVPVGPVTVGIFYGPVAVNATEDASSKYLIAGAYQGTVSVTVTPIS